MDVDRYYWDVIPRDKAVDFIKALTRELNAANVSCQKYSIQKLRGTYQQLKKIKESILQLVGIRISRGALAVEETGQILDRCVEVTDIPFLSDDLDKLKKALRHGIEQDRKVKVEDIISPVKGKMSRAIVTFASTEGMCDIIILVHSSRVIANLDNFYHQQKMQQIVWR